ncbi:CPBP family intramembrane glutamic endopeptidase [Caproiciproducens sp. CPB-2]|uniref:CPBP family intramembrane glutamic endopeptidase n=1 Tax=unclassified Caproiciproducens TaxID=2643836 RepID=UPI0023DC7C91|nr:type II CAAX endopeptidase family protein [Caproiciproducens sp. CPB-2]MDF1493838.1 type II CAAX endopeptidase family protein [Caproiciproducens sp. CPB-2]
MESEIEAKNFRTTVTKVALCLILSDVFIQMVLAPVVYKIILAAGGTTNGLPSRVIWVATGYMFNFLVVFPLIGKILHIHLLHLWNSAKVDVKNMKYYIPVEYTFAAIGLFLFCIPLSALFQRAGLQSPSHSEIGSNGPFLLTILLIVIGVFIAPLSEEILCRGLLLSAFAPYGKCFAIIMSSVFFSLGHGNFTQLFQTFLFGLVLAYVTLETGSIKSAYILHVINNGLTLIPNTIAIYVIIAILGGIGIWVLIKKRQMILKNLRKEKENFVPVEHRIRRFFSNPLMLFYLIYLIAKLILSVQPL